MPGISLHSQNVPGDDEDHRRQDASGMLDSICASNNPTNRGDRVKLGGDRRALRRGYSSPYVRWRRTGFTHLGTTLLRRLVRPFRV